MPAKIIILVLLMLLRSVQQISAAGGLAELKAITGDAPYLGTGNQEIAGEYYVSRSGGQTPYSNYAYNRPYSQQYYSPCRNGGGGNYHRNDYNAYNAYNSQSAGATNTRSGRYYQGSGNAYVNG